MLFISVFDFIVGCVLKQQLKTEVVVINFKAFLFIGCQADTLRFLESFHSAISRVQILKLSA